MLSTLMRAISIFPRSTRVAISRRAALASASRFSRRILMRCMDSLRSKEDRNFQSYKVSRLAELVVGLWCGDRPDLNLMEA